MNEARVRESETTVVMNERWHDEDRLNERDKYNKRAVSQKRIAIRLAREELARLVFALFLGVLHSVNVVTATDVFQTRLFVARSTSIPIPLLFFFLHLLFLLFFLFLIMETPVLLTAFFQIFLFSFFLLSSSALT